jgi:hypothetical protein
LENRAIREDYLEIAQEIIKTEKCLADVRNSSVSFVVLGSDSERKKKGKLLYGECERVPAKYSWIIPYDFTITIFEPNVERFTEDQIRILLLHELMHMGIEKDGNEEKYFVVPHDVEDFSEILERYGVGWDDTVGEVKKARKRS